MRALKGWRTILFSFFLAAVGVLEATDWANLIPDGPNKGWILLVIAIMVAWLRIITTTPVGQNDEESR